MDLNVLNNNPKVIDALFDEGYLDVGLHRFQKTCVS